jgi:integrase
MAAHRALGSVDTRFRAQGSPTSVEGARHASLKGGIVSDISLLLAVTGFRSGEVRLLKWSEVDIPRQTVVLSETKTGVSIRTISVAAIEIIKRQKQSGSPYVFDYHDGKPID